MGGVGATGPLPASRGELRVGWGGFCFLRFFCAVVLLFFFLYRLSCVVVSPPRLVELIGDPRLAAPLFPLFGAGQSSPRSELLEPGYAARSGATSLQNCHDISYSSY